MKNKLELLPFIGKRKARKRWAELEREAGTLPVFFALFVMEWAKVRVGSIPLPVPRPERLLIAGIICGVLYIYDIGIQDMKEASGKAKERAKEKAKGEE